MACAEAGTDHCRSGFWHPAGTNQSNTCAPEPCLFDVEKGAHHKRTVRCTRAQGFARVKGSGHESVRVVVFFFFFFFSSK